MEILFKYTAEDKCGSRRIVIKQVRPILSFLFLGCRCLPDVELQIVSDAKDGIDEPLKRGKCVINTDDAPAWGDGNDNGGRLVYYDGIARAR